MKKCFACRRFILPWSRIGWVVDQQGRVSSFHPTCHPWRSR